MEFYHNADIGDIIVWVFGLLTVFSIWGGVVEQSVEKIKPTYRSITDFVFGMLTRLGVADSVIRFLNDFSIIGAIYAAAYLTAQGGYNIFASAPARLTIHPDLQI